MLCCRYIYTESLDLQSMDQAMGICYAAQKYILPHLVAKCVQYMMINLCPKYTCRVLEFTNLLEDGNLKVYYFPIINIQVYSNF